MRAPHLFVVSFDRIGRQHNVPDLTVNILDHPEWDTADSLATAIYQYAQLFTLSRDPDVDVTIDPETWEGTCTILWGRGGRGTIKPFQVFEPEAGRTVLVASVVIALLAALVVLFASQVSAQTITAPVSYEVGDVLVFASRTRNDSCSITRNVRNTGTIPVQVLGTASWDGAPDHLPPNQGQFRNGATIQPGEQYTATWTNSHYVTDGPLYLTWSVIDPADPDPLSVGDNHLEPVPACSATPPPPPSSVPTVPEETAPPTTVGATVPDPVEPPDTAPGPETTTSLDTGVLTSSIQRTTLTELPATGPSQRLRDLGITLLGFGLAITLASRRPRKAGQP